MTYTLASMIRRFARERPTAPALTFGDVTRSYSALDADSTRVAHALRETGVRPGDRVAILTKNTAEFYDVAFGCSKLGAILVGLNWRLAPAEIAAIASDAQPAVIIVSPGEGDLLDGDVREAPWLQRIIVLGDDFVSWRDMAPVSELVHDAAPDDVAMLLYTSGTTGVPKGVVLTNGNMSFTPEISRVAFGFGEKSVNLVAMPLFHIGGIGYGLSAFAHGGHTVLLRDADPVAVLRSIGRFGVTHAFFVPAVIQMIVSSPEVAASDLASLELLVYGASPISESLLRQALSVLGCEFAQAYGMTETAGTAVCLAPADHDPDGPNAALLRSCGRPLPWFECRLIDPKTQTDAAPGVVGEIWLRSAQISPGYWNKPEATAEAITPDGWLRTGDAAYADDRDYLFLFDRFKDMIVSGGENVYPAEVENAFGDHPAIAEVAVIGVPSERWGETVKAVVVVKAGASVTEPELIEYCRSRLARYKCPTSVDFVAELPRNASGKLLKKDLRAQFWTGHQRPVN
jgi:acyl-CoA synthetase (AMP-forming)/AMP-acid ligase II